MQNLVNRYIQHRNDYTDQNSLYRETDVREDFINQFFELLGWDIVNRRGLPHRLREVVRETRVEVGEQTKRPDYEFRLGPERKFFVEAKRPNIDITNHRNSAFQARRYGWSANLKISILTNFEHLVIYDTSEPPTINDSAVHSRLHCFHYIEYVDRFDEIASLISREAVYSGQFDERFSAVIPDRPNEAVDILFLQQLNQWRVQLGQDIVESNPEIDRQTLNRVVERFILRILFLRMCEDRGIQTYQELQQIAAENDWARFVSFLTDIDRRYDSGLFATTNDPLCIAGQRRIQLDTTTVKQIIDSLYFPMAPYTFAVFEPDFLGYVYERFLYEKLFVAETVTLAPKPENEGRDVVPTPQPLISRIVEDTLQTLLNTLRTRDLAQIKILDPACGSGGFLVTAFGRLVDAMVAVYLAEDNRDHIYETPNGWQLTFERKCELLLGSIYGVDRDYSAVEVTRFSLLVKLLENESVASLPAGDAILPTTSQNVVFGDSLVDERIYDYDEDPTMVGIPLTWGEDLPHQFNCVMGNPPYLKTEDIKSLEPAEYEFYKKRGHYHTAFKQFDKYYLFIERIVNSLLTKNGVCGLVVSRKFSHVESGKKVRALLSKESFIQRMVDFGNAQMFRGRTTYTCLLFFKKSHSQKADEVPFSYEPVNTPQDWLRQQQQTQFTMPIPRQYVSGENAWVLPSTSDELSLLRAMASNSISLSEIVDIFNGIQTSRNDVYVITNWIEDSEYTIKFEADGKYWQIEKSILRPFFEDNVVGLRSFYPLPTTALVIFPYLVAVKNGQWSSTVIPADLMQSDYPLTYEWLLHNQDILSCRSISPGRYPAEEWYRYGRQQALTSFENRPKIIVGVNSLGDKYVYDDSSNTLLASGGTAGECAISHFRDSEKRSSYDLYFIHALLNHKAVEYFCRKRGSPFRGGWFARGTAVLSEIPIPKIDFDAHDERYGVYLKIGEINRSLHNICATLDITHLENERGRLKRQKRALKNKMDALISNLYSITTIIEHIELLS